MTLGIFVNGNVETAVDISICLTIACLPAIDCKYLITLDFVTRIYYNLRIRSTELEIDVRCFPSAAIRVVTLATEDKSLVRS